MTRNKKSAQNDGRDLFLLLLHEGGCIKQVGGKNTSKKEKTKVTQE